MVEVITALVLASSICTGAPRIGLISIASKLRPLQKVCGGGYSYSANPDKTTVMAGGGGGGGGLPPELLLLQPVRIASNPISRNLWQFNGFGSSHLGISLSVSFARQDGLLQGTF